MSPGIGLIVFLGGAFGFMFAIEKTKNSAAGVPGAAGFTFFMGLMLARLIGAVLGLANGASLIMMAFASTGVVFLGMAALSSGDQARPLGHGQVSLHRRHHGAGGGIANFFLHHQRADADAVGAGHRHLLGLHPYDLKQVRTTKTNYISATLERVPGHVYNVFQGLLSLFGIAGRATTDGSPAGGQRRRARGPGFVFGPFLRRTAIDSTCAVCGNMFTTPASRSGSRPGAPAGPASRASVAGCSSRRRCAAAYVQPGAGSDRRAVRPAPWRARKRFARRIDQPFVGRTVGPGRPRGQLEQVARRGKGRGNTEAVALRVLARALHQRLAAFDAQHLARRAGRQLQYGKLPRPQNQSITAQAAARPSSRRNARDTSTLLIWWFTWVKSVGLNGITMPNSARVEGQFRAAFVEVHGVRPLGCSHHCTPCSAAKARRREVGSESGSGGAAPAPSPCRHHHLDLRRASLLHTGDQLAQPPGSMAERCGGSTSLALHVGHEAGLALVETDQRLALLGDKPPTAARDVMSPSPSIGRSSCSAFTLPRCQARLPARALTVATCAATCSAASCSRRSGRSAGTATARAANSRAARRWCTPSFLRRCRRAALAGQRVGYERHLPSASCATPCASRSSDSTDNHSSAAVMARLSAAPLLHSRRARESFLVKPPKAQNLFLGPGSNAQAKDWHAPRVKRAAFLAGEARLGAGPPKGQAMRQQRAPPISQVKRTEGRHPAWHAGRAWQKTLETHRRRRSCPNIAAEDSAARPAPRTRRQDGALRRLRHAGELSRGHPRRTPALPRVGGAVRRLRTWARCG